MKDFERRQNLDSFICINPIELKKEAIKWVLDCAMCQNKHRCLACLRTMEMNNITEEDLK